MYIRAIIFKRTVLLYFITSRILVCKTFYKKNPFEYSTLVKRFLLKYCISIFILDLYQYNVYRDFRNIHRYNIHFRCTVNNSHFYKVKRADPVHACLLFYANNAWRSEFEYKTRLLNYNTFFSLLLQMSHACFTYESVKFACFVRFLGVVLNNLY